MILIDYSGDSFSNPHSMLSLNKTSGRQGVRELTVSEIGEVSGSCPPCAAAAVAAYVAVGAIAGAATAGGSFILGSTFAHIGNAGSGSFNFRALGGAISLGAIRGGFSGPFARAGAFYGTAAAGFAGGYASYQISGR